MQRSAGRSVTATARRLVWPHVLAVATLSAGANLLLLAGPIYMLQIYDRVLGSGSLPTLAVLSLIVVLAFAFLGAFDWIRLKMMSRIASIVEGRLFAPAFRASLDQSRFGPAARGEPDPVDDVETIRQYLAGGGPIFLFDAPWLPIFLMFVFLLHPLLGLLATGCAVLLVSITVGGEWLMRSRMTQTSAATSSKRQFVRSAQFNGEAAVSMGMCEPLVRRAEAMTAQSLDAQLQVSDTGTMFSTATKVFRLITQSAILGLGAMLAVWGEVSPGAMIAASIISARALSPVEQAASGWRHFIAARQAIARLSNTLVEEPPAPTLRLPDPRESLSVTDVGLLAEGRERPVLQRISFELKAGQALGVIGSSAAGKTSLARALVGLWPPARGEIRLDGARLDQWTPEALSRHIGYLPQRVELFSGTIAENISRFDPRVKSENVLAAAEAAGVHDLILRLPEGYETVVGVSDRRLSAGQIQRIGLARALYGNPFVVVLDEPNSALDQAGEEALVRAIRTLRGRGSIVVVITHRPGIIGVTDHVLVLSNGQQHSCGPRDEIFRALNQQAARPRVAA